MHVSSAFTPLPTASPSFTISRRSSIVRRNRFGHRRRRIAFSALRNSTCAASSLSVLLAISISKGAKSQRIGVSSAVSVPSPSFATFCRPLSKVYRVLIGEEGIQKLETRIREMEKAARDAQAKADAIDAAVFDLKAVNPNAVVKLDQRTPEEVIRSIEDHGRVVAEALSALRKLISNGQSSAADRGGTGGGHE